MAEHARANRFYIAEQGWYQLVSEVTALANTTAQEMVYLFGLPGRESLNLRLLIRVHCAVRGINKKELANSSGVMPCTLSRIEKDPDYSPQSVTLKKLEDFLGAGFSHGLDVLFPEWRQKLDEREQSQM